MSDSAGFSSRESPEAGELAPPSHIAQWAGRDAVARDKIEGDQVRGDKITTTYVYEGSAYPRLAYRQEVGQLIGSLPSQYLATY
jgi:hypothetical protein